MKQSQWKVQLSELNFNEDERSAVQSVLNGEWLTMGNETKSFEQEFSNFIGHANPGIFVSSATAALHLILMALDVKAGDEVIIPSLTFVSDANVVLQLGAKPVFADINSLTDLNVSVQSIIDKINNRTKAIIIVHFAGYPMSCSKLYEECNRRGIALIEDCAHSPGGSIGEVKCGVMGHFSFFSFFSNKNLAVGEGGMIFARNDGFDKMLRLMRSHGMSAPTLDRHLGRAKTYDVVSLGLNYRADEIRAAIGRVQLKKLNMGNLQRKKITERYMEILKNTDILVPFCATNTQTKSAYHIFPIVLPISVNRNDIMDKMKEKGVQTSIHYPSFKSFSAYRELTKDLNSPISDDLSARELTLPLHPKMSFDEVEYVTDALLGAL